MSGVARATRLVRWVGYRLAQARRVRFSRGPSGRRGSVLVGACALGEEDAVPSARVPVGERARQARVPPQQRVRQRRAPTSVGLRGVGSTQEEQPDAPGSGSGERRLGSGWG